MYTGFFAGQMTAAGKGKECMTYDMSYIVVST